MSPSKPSARRVRSIDITGVMPLPPETNRIRRAARSSAKSPASPCWKPIPTTMPGCAKSHRKVDTRPPSWRPMVNSIERCPLGVGRRIAARVPTAVDLDGEIDVPAGPKFGVHPCTQRVRLQREGDAARRAAPHLDHRGPRLAIRPGGVHQLGVAVDAVRSGQHAHQRRSQHSAPEAGR